MSESIYGYGAPEVLQYKEPLPSDKKMDDLSNNIIATPKYMAKGLISTGKSLARILASSRYAHGANDLSGYILNNLGGPKVWTQFGSEATGIPTKGTDELLQNTDNQRQLISDTIAGDSRLYKDVYVPSYTSTVPSVFNSYVGLPLKDRVTNYAKSNTVPYMYHGLPAYVGNSKTPQFNTPGYRPRPADIKSSPTMNYTGSYYHPITQAVAYRDKVNYAKPIIQKANQQISDNMQHQRRNDEWYAGMNESFDNTEKIMHKGLDAVIPKNQVSTQPSHLPTIPELPTIGRFVGEMAGPGIGGFRAYRHLVGPVFHNLDNLALAGVRKFTPNAYPLAQKLMHFGDKMYVPSVIAQHGYMLGSDPDSPYKTLLGQAIGRADQEGKKVSPDLTVGNVLEGAAHMSPATAAYMRYVREPIQKSIFNYMAGRHPVTKAKVIPGVLGYDLNTLKTYGEQNGQSPSGQLLYNGLVNTATNVLNK